MTSPVFLTLDSVLETHAEVIRASGGMSGVLNLGALESALASPAQGFGGRYLNEFPFEMAAALIVGLAKNHAFADGNKRTATLCGLGFLEANGYTCTLSDADLERLILDVATSVVGKGLLAMRLKASCVRIR